MTLPIGLTPPATPPHQMWKPIAPVSLLGKTKSEVLKPTSNKAIQIEARPLPSNMLCSKPQTPTTTPQTQPFSLDHDYCLPPKDPCQNEVGNRWNVKQQPSIIIKTVELPPNKPAQNSISKASTSPLVTEGAQINLRFSQPSADKRCTSNSSALETPDASPNRPDSESSLLGEAKCNRQKFVNYSEHSSRQDRGRSKRRYRVRSSSSSESSSESSSRSCSPPRKRSALMWLCTYIMIRKECWQHHRSRGYCQTCIFTFYRYRSRHSSSRSSSSSRSRSNSRSFSPPRQREYSSSRSGSWSRSRSRSLSSDIGQRRWNSHRRWPHVSVLRSIFEILLVFINVLNLFLFSFHVYFSYLIHQVKNLKLKWEHSLWQLVEIKFTFILYFISVIVNFISNNLFFYGYILGKYNNRNVLILSLALIRDLVSGVHKIPMKIQKDAKRKQLWVFWSRTMSRFFSKAPWWFLTS